MDKRVNDINFFCRTTESPTQTFFMSSRFIPNPPKTSLPLMPHGNVSSLANSFTPAYGSSTKWSSLCGGQFWSTIKLHRKSISKPLQQIWWACCVFFSSLSSTFFSILVIIFSNISYFCFDHTRSLIIRILFSFIPRIIFLICIENYNDAHRGHMTSFLWKWKLYDFFFQKRLMGHILNKIIVIWFVKPASFS